MINRLILFLTALIWVGHIHAASPIAGDSARLALSPTVTKLSNKTYSSSAELIAKHHAIQKVLIQYNSPLIVSTQTFMQRCMEYDMDCYLLPAITGLESTFGQAILPGSYNPFGWGGGYIMFKNWDHAINTVAQGVAKNYIGRGATSVEAIGSKYAASTTWAPRVRGFMAQFKRAEAAELKSAQFQLEL
jgi:hypothetical protein